MDKQEIIAFERKVEPAIVRVQKLHIKNVKDIKEAVQTLSLINKYADQVREKRETVTKPLNEALKNARALFKPVENKLDGAVALLREAMSEYQTRETTKQRIEEGKIIDRVGEGKGKIKLDTAVSKIEGLAKVDDEIVAESGTVKFREDKVLKIIDKNIVPFEYFVLDEKKLVADLKEGKQVPGAILEIKMTPLNYRHE